ncbi:AsmA-like C-terminal region-containing protein [Bernardetia sp. OM2101]|uniref:AsmA-like C-terminal region-containing protein n=1 Tax=Bernardetia sp. OM2101 TaxID=3344876 RepID=UPI0035CF2961
MKIFKRKKLWRWLLIGFITLFISVLIAPYILYKNQDFIAEKVTEKLNEMQVGHTTLGGLHISPFKNFPYISVDLEDLKFYSSDDETQRPVYAFEDVYIGFDAWKLLGGEYTIKKVVVQKGELHIIRFEDSTINLVLAKSLNPKELKTELEKAEKDENNHFHLDLKSIELVDIFVEKEDRLENNLVQTQIKKAKSTFIYNTSFIDNHLDIDFELVDLNLHKMDFFVNKHINIISDIHYNLKDNYLDIDPSELHIEGGIFGLEGRIDIENDIFMDLVVSGKKPDFKLITSFAPPDVYKKLEKYRNEGEVYFKGIIQGKAMGNAPQITLEFGCKNAHFINPNSSKSINDLSFAGFYTNGEEHNLKTSELYLENLSGKPNESFVKGSFHVINFDDPYFSIDLHSNLNLTSLYELFELDMVKDLKGQAIIDMNIDELLDANDIQSILGKLKDGTDSRIILKDVSFSAPDYYPHPIKNLNAKASFVGGKLQIDYFDIAIEDSKLELSGLVSNLTALLHNKDADVEADLKGKASKLNLPVLLAFDSALSKSTTEVISNLVFDTKFLTNTKYIRQADGIPQGEFLVDSLFFDLKNYAHTIHDFHIDIMIDENDVRVKRFHGEIDKSNFDLDAYLKNYHALLPKHDAKPIEFYIDIKSDNLIFNDLLTYEGKNYLPEEYKDETLKDFEVEALLNINSKDLLASDFFKNTDLKLTDLHGKFRQHKLKVEGLHGDFSMRKGDLSIKNFSGRLGKSDIKLEAQLFNYFDSTKTSKAKVKLVAQNLDVNEIMNYEEPKKESNKSLNKVGETALAANHDSVFNIFSIEFPNLELDAKVGDLTYHNYHLTNITTQMRSTSEHYLYIDSLSFGSADGHFGLNGYFNGSDPTHIYFDSDLKIDDADLDRLFFRFDNFGQDFLVKENIHGRISGTVKSKVRMHTDLVPYLSETEAHAELNIRDGSLVNFPPFEAFSDYMGDKNLQNVRFGELANIFNIKKGNVDIPRMEISSSLEYMFISGTQNFDTDLKMNYVVEVPFKLVRQAAWQAMFKKNKKAAKDLEKIENEIQSSDPDKNAAMISINIFGTPEDFDFKMGKGKRKRK